MTEPLISPGQRISDVESIVRENPQIVGVQTYEYFRSSIFTTGRGQFDLLFVGKLDLTRQDYLEIAQDIQATNKDIASNVYQGIDSSVE